MMVRGKYKLQPFHIIPFMMIPVTADYLKREFFVQQVAQKERKELAERRNVVQKIINEKKSHVTFE
jgi:argonaute-like protein implicated in RNA metabolism and viral defense